MYNLYVKKERKWNHIRCLIKTTRQNKGRRQKQEQRTRATHRKQ